MPSHALKQHRHQLGRGNLTHARRMQGLVDMQHQLRHRRRALLDGHHQRCIDVRRQVLQDHVQHLHTKQTHALAR